MKTINQTTATPAVAAIKSRLEYLRGELRAERISYGELSELQSLAAHIALDDVELREAAGLPESPMETTATPAVHAIQPLPAELPEQPSPVPWEAEYNRLHNRWQLHGPQGYFGHFGGWSADGVTTEAEDKANIELIVRAVNSRARLVAACEAAIVHMLIAAGLNPERTYCYNWIVEPLDPCACQVCNIRAALAAAKVQP